MLIVVLYLGRPPMPKETLGLRLRVPKVMLGRRPMMGQPTIPNVIMFGRRLTMGRLPMLKEILGRRPRVTKVTFGRRLSPKVTLGRRPRVLKAY